MEGITNVVNELFVRRSRNISVARSNISEQFLSLLIKEGHIVAKKVSKNSFKVEKMCLNNVAVINRRPLRAAELLPFAIQVVPTITGAVVISTNQGLMTHHEAIQKNIGGRVMAIVY